MSLPAIFTMPAVGRSSPPRICSSVVLPDPEAPMMARRSPARTVRLTPCSTVRSIGPWRNARVTPVASSTCSVMAPSFMSLSFMAQGLCRQRAAGAPRRVDSRQRRQRESRQRDLQHVAEADFGRQIAHEVHTRIQELYTEDTFDPVDGFGDIERQEPSEQRTRERAHQTDERALYQEHPQ